MTAMVLAELEVWHSRPVTPDPPGGARSSGAARRSRRRASAGCSSAPSWPPTCRAWTRSWCPTSTGSSTRSSAASGSCSPGCATATRSIATAWPAAPTGSPARARRSASTSRTTARRSSRSSARSTPSSAWRRTRRHAIAAVLHRALRWNGPAGPCAHRPPGRRHRRRGSSLSAFIDPVAWALDVLGFPPGTVEPAQAGRPGPVPGPAHGGPPRPRRRRDRGQQGHRRPRRGPPDPAALMAARMAAPTSQGRVGALLLAPGAGSSSQPPVARRHRGRRWRRCRSSAWTSPTASPAARRRIGRPCSSPRSGTRRRRWSSAAGVAAERLALGGRSMGGRMCSMAVADGLPAAALVLISYPLHPPGRPDNAAHRPPAVAAAVPCLFVRAPGIPFGSPDELTAATATIPGPVDPRVDRRWPPRPEGRRRSHRGGSWRPGCRARSAPCLHRRTARSRRRRQRRRPQTAVRSSGLMSSRVRRAVSG